MTGWQNQHYDMYELGPPSFPGLLPLIESEAAKAAEDVPPVKLVGEVIPPGHFVKLFTHLNSVTDAKALPQPLYKVPNMLLL